MSLIQKICTFSVMFVLLTGTAFAEEARSATISKLSGSVDVLIQNEAWKPAEAGMTLHQDDQIRTGSEGKAMLSIDQGETAKVELKENGLLKVNTLIYGPQHGDKITYFDLAQGKVKVSVKKLKGDSKFEVRTPNAVTGVLGTIFEVSVKEKPRKRSEEEEVVSYLS